MTVSESRDRLKDRYFEVFGTGHSIYYDMGIDRKYINTNMNLKSLY